MKLHKASKRTIALFAAALILFSSGGVLGSRAALTVQSEDYDATIVLDELDVALVENGTPTADNDGQLLSALQDSKLAPGKTYDEKIAVENTGTADEYIRLVVRKYWTNDGEKNTDLSPDLIKLAYGDEDYNTGAWTLNEDESTDEMAVYYCKSKVAAGKTTDLLFDTVSVDASIISDDNVSVETSEAGGKTIYKYTYKYDGYTINVKAEAQAVQTHSAEDAIKSIWGVDAGKVGINL